MQQQQQQKQQLKDLLYTVTPMQGCKWAAFSIVSPENIVKKREMFFFEQFARRWDLIKSMSKFSIFLEFMATKYGINKESLEVDFTEFITAEKETLLNISAEVEDDYKTFIDQNYKQLDKQFKAKHPTEPFTTRGLRIYGCADSDEDIKAYKTQIYAENEGNEQSDIFSHDILTGPCGFWMPFDENARGTEREEYQEPELNRLMHEKEKNEAAAKAAFDARRRNINIAAVQTNEENARKYNTFVTQTVDENGELVRIPVAEAKRKQQQQKQTQEDNEESSVPKDANGQNGANMQNEEGNSDAKGNGFIDMLRPDNSIPDELLSDLSDVVMPPARGSKSENGSSDHGINQLSETARRNLFGASFATTTSTNTPDQSAAAAAVIPEDSAALCDDENGQASLFTLPLKSSLFF